MKPEAMMRIHVEPLTAEAFAEFGVVLGEPSGVEPAIRDAVSDVWLGFAGLMGIGARPGMACTYLKIHSVPECSDKLEQHQSSAEAFIPLVGQSILWVVPAEALDAAGIPDLARARAFLMDGNRGVLMRPGTWHAVPYKLTDVATYLVLVDETIIARDDLHVTPVEPVEFELPESLVAAAA
jgi:ureidoglycolate lyase